VENEDQAVGVGAEQADDEADDEHGLHRTDPVGERIAEAIECVELLEYSGRVLRVDELVCRPHDENTGDAEPKPEQTPSELAVQIWLCLRLAGHLSFFSIWFGLLQCELDDAALQQRICHLGETADIGTANVVGSVAILAFAIWFGMKLFIFIGA
jgi:hypothetical protein